MAGKRTARPLSLAVLLAAALSTAAVAQQQVGFTQYVGIPTNLMNQYYAQQRASQWCWAASIQMVLQRYGVAAEQEEIVRRTYGTDPRGNLPDQPASVQTMTANLNNWSIDRAGKRYIVRASLIPGPPAHAALISELTAGCPVILGCRVAAGGHAVVCTGASYVLVQSDPYNRTPPVPIIKTLIIRDPMPQGFWANFTGSAPRGRVEYKGEDIAKIIGAHWFIRVQIPGQPQLVVNTAGLFQLVGEKPPELGKTTAPPVEPLPGPQPPGQPTSKAPSPEIYRLFAALPGDQPKDDDVKLTQSDTRWLEGESQPYAEFAFTYTNMGAQNKSCEVTVDVELASRKTEELVRVCQSRTFTFELRPGRSYTVKGALDGYQDLDVHPRLNSRLYTTAQ